MAISNGHVLRVSNLWNYLNIAYQMNVLHVQVSDITTQTQDQIRDDLRDYLEAAYGSCIGYAHVDLDHERTDIFVTQTGAPEQGLDRIVLLDGNSAGESLPLQLAVEIYFRTGVARHIGRIYLPTFTEAANNNGVVLAAIRADCLSMGTYLLTPHTMTNGTTFTFGILDRSSAVFRQPTQAIVPVHFRTQRRRRIGVGM